MRITEKGQVTIPVEIRERLGLLPHTEVEFEVDGNTVRIHRVPDPEAGRGRRLVAHLRGRGTVGLTTEEIMALTRGER
jgi:AbrB family looped-hinge helix DNA binding protein